MFYVGLRENRDNDIVSMADFLVETKRAESRTEALLQLMREGMLRVSQTRLKLIVDSELKMNNPEPEPEFQFMNSEIPSNLTNYKSLIMENKELRGQLEMVAHELQRVNRMGLKKQLEEQAKENRQKAI
ncbi:MAG: hypothetical protein P4L69_14175 [Desulfosporosinus sp.]|nr:hypothetical protein [Desulfosporosinus sp.]